MSEKYPGGGGGDGKNIYNWSDIRNDIVSETPDEMTFGDCYDAKTLAKDRQRIHKIKEQLGIKGETGISDSRIQEYATAQEIVEMDWFGEEQRYDSLFSDDKGSQTAIFLTSEYDDFVNHIDAIGLMDNADSNYQPVPFALDMTYNVDADNLAKKMSWPHPDQSVNMPGFAAAKYFEDTYNGEPLLKKGKIAIMPRFIIGYDPELSVKITRLRMNTKGWDSLQRTEASTKAKWCVLRELKAQSSRLLERLEESGRGNELLETAYSQVTALDKYFDGAIATAQETDKNHPDWIRYGNNDAVANAILSTIL